MANSATVLTWKRFREINTGNESVLSGNRVASIRNTRTKRRLYMMVVSIITPYLPIVVSFQVYSILGMHSIKPYSYYDIHHPEGPFGWNTIALYPASEVDWVIMNQCYIAVVTAVPIFLFFGMTKDACNDYRKVAVFFGLGRVFPRLNEEYDPDREALAGSYGSSQFMTVIG